MSRLDAAKTPDDGPIIITVAGEAGVGKTSFAATFPKPIFIQAEKGMQSIPHATRPPAFPALESHTDLGNLWQDLAALLQDEHDYKTLVIDSVTALETLFIDHVVKTDSKGAKSLAEAGGGYGAGYQIVASNHVRVRKYAEALRQKRGMNVVFISHTDIETIDPPDGTPYSKLSLRLNKRSMQPYVDNVDAVMLIALQSYSRAAAKKNNEDRAKVFSDGTRIITMHASAAHVSKNRFGITEDIILAPGTNPLIDLIPSLQAVK